MDPITIIFGLWAGVMATVSAYGDGKQIWKSWREKRRAKRVAKLGYYDQSFGSSTPFPTYQTPPRRIRSTSSFDDESRLEQNLTTSPRQVEAAYQRMYTSAGPLFRRGDNISTNQLKTSLARFQRNLLAKVNASIAAMTSTMELNIGNLMAESNAFRTGNISSMTDLFQRVNVQRPIVRPLAIEVGTGMGYRSSGSSRVGGGGFETGSGTAAVEDKGCWCQRVTSSSFTCGFCGNTGGVAVH